MANAILESGQVVSASLYTTSGDRIEVKLSLEEAIDLAEALVEAVENPNELDTEDLLTLDGNYIEADNLTVDSLDTDALDIDTFLLGLT